MEGRQCLKILIILQKRCLGSAFPMQLTGLLDNEYSMFANCIFKGKTKNQIQNFEMWERFWNHIVLNETIGIFEEDLEKGMVWAGIDLCKCSFLIPKVLLC
jgi:hypothetical protein